MLSNEPNVGLYMFRLQGSSISVVYNGSLSLSTSCFIENNSRLPGSVYMQNNSNIILNERNYGLRNNGSETCSDIFLESIGSDCERGSDCDGTCVSFGSTECLAEDFTRVISEIPSRFPTISRTPSFQPSLSFSPSVSFSPTLNTSCFSDWKDLSDTVDEYSTFQRGRTFTLCPNTFFDLPSYSGSSVSPIKIGSSNIIIRCGESGLREESCIVYKGSRQFEIIGSVSGVEFQGITFFGSNDVSVIASGNSNIDVSFMDCVVVVSIERHVYIYLLLFISNHTFYFSFFNSTILAIT